MMAANSSLLSKKRYFEATHNEDGQLSINSLAWAYEKNHILEKKHKIINENKDIFLLYYTYIGVPQMSTPSEVR